MADFGIAASSAIVVVCDIIRTAGISIKIKLCITNVVVCRGSVSFYNPVAAAIYSNGIPIFIVSGKITQCGVSAKCIGRSLIVIWFGFRAGGTG